MGCVTDTEAPAVEFDRGDHYRAPPPRAGLSQRFVSRALPLFKRRTREVGDLLPTLYLHGWRWGISTSHSGLLAMRRPYPRPP